MERRYDAAAPRLVQHCSVKDTCNADGLQQAIGHATRCLNAKHLPEQLAWPRPLTIVHYTFFSIHPLKKKNVWPNFSYTVTAPSEDPLES